MFIIRSIVCIPVLARPLLTSVWRERISRILSIENCHYTVFIQPDLLASFSFGLEPNQAIKTLIRANQIREYSCLLILNFFFLVCLLWVIL